MRWRSEVNMWRSSDQGGKEEEEEEQVEVLLRGKAPWGFTLRGGSEHREPLVITKVEEGGVAAAAAAVCLQAGDELVSVNAVPLSGSRLEVISLVKSSQKTLTLVVRRPKMVDVVSPCTMPSDTEVHVARSFLTKILRSSMRKNDPGSRPHSWHSSKLTEEEEELVKREDTASPVWQPKNVSESKEQFSHGDQDSQHQLTRKFCSVNNMERLGRPVHPFTQGRLSPTRYTSAEALCRPGGRRESGLSCFSSGVSPPPPLHDSSSSGRKGSSAENVFFKGHRAEGQQQGEWPRLPRSTPGPAGREGLGAEEQPAPRVSIAGRPSTSSLWKVPEKKKSRASPPPPAPLRSDSFAVTKVFPYSEGPSCSAKTKVRSDETLSEHSDQNGLRSQQEEVPEARRSFNPLPTKDFRRPGSAADQNHNQLRPDKLFSLSSVDVRQSRYSLPPAHQRQYSDESPQYLKSRSAPPTKIQSVGSYYRSLQDLPRNAFGHKPVRHSTASTSGSVVNTIPENGGHRRHYGVANNGRAEGRRGETEKLQWANNEAGVQSSLKPNVKAKFSLPQLHTPQGEDPEQDYPSHQKNGLHRHHQTSDLSVQNRGPEDSAERVEGQSNDNKTRFLGNGQKISLWRPLDPWVPQEDRRISPLKTPFLHSLAQESKTSAERQSAALTAGFLSSQDAGEIASAGGGKSNRRSDRYATTLRNEVQQKRAQLQKSRSAATLTCDGEEEEAEDWRSARTSTYSGVSSSNSYKDHLKEAQARVLQATSFQRRDLEPLGPEVVRTSNGRVRGRKRLPLVQRGHSFSEPDKIDKVGVEGEPPAGTFGERRKFFEAKPAFPRPAPKSNQGPKLNSDLGDTNKTKERSPSGDPEDAPPSTDPCHLNPGQEEVFLEQQRLGTFAEYQATWNQQKKSSEPTQGRYHSAENILDADAEDDAVCVHERSRSSPSADFCTQNIPSAWRDPHGQQSRCTSREPAENRNRYQSDHSPHSSLSVPRNQVVVPELTDHRPKPDSAGPTHNTHSLVPLSLSPNSGPQNPSQLPQTKGLLPQTGTHLETTSSSSSSSSQEFPSGAGPAQAAADGSRTEEVKERAPSSSSPTSAWTPARSPSPPFAPPRLSDTPPPAVLVLRDESRFRSEHDLKFSAEMDVSGPAKRVPVRIVHSESSSDPEGGASRNRGICCLTLPPPHTPSLRSTERPAPPLIKAGPPNQNREPVPEINPVGVLQTEEDAKREELARDIMGKDKSLVDILDQTGRKTTMDLMEGLFPTEDPILEGVLQRKRASSASRVPTSSPRSEERREGEDMAVSAASLVPSSSYYNTSAPKAELLIKMKDMQQHLLEEQDSEDELDVDLASKKQELISSLAAKLEVLREARHSLQEDMEDNEALGREVETTVQRLCRPNQLDKFRMFVGDLDKVVSLLLSLSGRLARVENALNSLEEEAPPEEKRTLTEKRKLLMRQHEDAKELKENLDRRERLVSGIMEAHLGAESLDDYRHFVKMKSGLIIEQRKLEDKIKLGEEQLKCLVDSLPLEQRLLL